jgi:hypothetical protein
MRMASTIEDPRHRDMFLATDWNAPTMALAREWLGDS